MTATYSREKHGVELVAWLRAYDNESLPDGAWQAMLEDGAKEFTKVSGVEIEPFEAFIEYVDMVGT